MPSLLVARKNGELLAQVDLSGRTKLTIGRSHRCDLTLDAPMVSRRHAVMFRFGEAWRVVDTASRTGVHRGEHRVRSACLDVHDWTRIGPAYLWLEDGSDSARDRYQSSSDSHVHDFEASAVCAPRFVLADLSGLVLQDAPLDGIESMTVGRDARCDFVIDDATLSPVHSLLYREDERWCIADVDSSSGTRVEGRLTHRRRLEDRMLIRIGGHLAWVAEGQSARQPARSVTQERVSAFLAADPNEATLDGASSFELLRRAG